MLSFLFLSGCGHDLFGSRSPNIIEKPVIVEKTIYPSLPRIPYPSSIALIPFEWSWPRIEDLDVINSKKCKSVDKAKHNTKFWKECGIPKVDLNSNIYIGMDEGNYKIFIQNWDRLLSREKQWRSIVNEINRQRKEFRNYNNNKKKDNE